MIAQETPVASPTVLDALRASPAGPALDLPLPAPPAPPTWSPEPELDAITEVLQSLPVPAVPGIDEMLRPLRDLGDLFGTGIVDALDPSAVLQQSSRMLDGAASLARTALHALPDSWEGAPAEAALDKGRQAQVTAVELSERGDEIGAVTRAATASVERGNVELGGIAQSFLAFATATAPVALTPPGQIALLTSAAEHVSAALAVVARTRGELLGYTTAMNALAAPIAVPAPVAAPGLPAADDVAAAATGAVDTVAGAVGVSDDLPAQTHAAAFGGGTVTAGPTMTAATAPVSTGAVAPGAGGAVAPGAGSAVALGAGGAVALGTAGGGLTGTPSGPRPPTSAPVTAAAAAARHPLPAAVPGTGRADEDAPRRARPTILVTAANTTAVIGEVPPATAPVIGAGDDW
ncbi:hypothetical protein RAJCM14343_5791 [Rhodococcus aetherivorans]|uniref:Uncharacterized protein n=1 Tax=Rhodococcus aetherivorans TaxID=191292 RepID=A0ABQ0YVU3_9NOCA|nr:hypothetical protein [Rhodococcus aetherivorans]ETT27461.1 hypothetical protein RR21198_1761 [Rhodococcus rhodochrous ATCC 21198]MDV6291889.1 hypothetical protein [Rhodococcus aetherivorans]NGP25409.1 hypothetical protein [Rhodococcus aetherivorans]GES40501.1 hypothetical protein RAJCM14343_5791 [Rhodococcus aetherivorans]